MSISELDDHVLVDILVRTPWPDMRQMYRTNRRHREVCQVYEETIFAQKIRNEFKLHNREQILTFVSGFASPVAGNNTTERLRNTLGFARLKYVYEFLYYCRRDPKLLHWLSGNVHQEEVYSSQTTPLKLLIRLRKVIPIWFHLLGKSDDSQFRVLRTTVHLQNETNDGPALTPQDLGNLFCEMLSVRTLWRGGTMPDRVIRLFVQEGSPDYSCHSQHTAGRPKRPLLALLLKRMAEDGKSEAFQREMLASALSNNPRPNLNAFDAHFDTVVMVALRYNSQNVVSDLLRSGLPINFSPFLFHFDKSQGLIHAAISSITETEEDFSEIYKYIITNTPNQNLTDVLVFAIMWCRDYLLNGPSENTLLREYHYKSFYTIFTYLTAVKIRHELVLDDSNATDMMSDIFVQVLALPNSPELQKLKMILRTVASKLDGLES
ncbi:hypothetical protein HK102_010759, partial [Quaeritorhiza haematococci]